MKRYDVQQLSDEWFELHRGRLTASRADKVVTPKQGKPSASIDDLACELVGESLSLIPPLRKPTNGPMQAGIEREPEARSWLAFDLGAEISEVGFITTDDGRTGCSPDGLATLPDGLYGVELKCVQPMTAVKWALTQYLPDEYRPQIHTGLIVADEVKGWIFASYCPPFSFWLKVYRDEFTELVAAAIEQFHVRHAEILARFTARAA